MEYEFKRISKSIDDIDRVWQVIGTFNWIKQFSIRFKDEMGVQEKEQILLTKLRNKEL
jgi:hypothetical protein